MLVRCKCGRLTSNGILCGFCSKNYSPRDARPPEEIDEYDEEYYYPKEDEEEEGE
jgi:hypothetical protein